MSDSKKHQSESVVGFHWKMHMNRAIKYIVEGVLVALAAWVIPRRNTHWDEVASIALIATATFAILDMWLPTIAVNARMGTGFGIGANLVGFPMMA